MVTPPVIDRQLVEYLKQTFPNRLPGEHEVDDTNIHLLIGQQKVIKHLEVLFNRQTEEQKI